MKNNKNPHCCLGPLGNLLQDALETLLGEESVGALLQQNQKLSNGEIPPWNNLVRISSMLETAYGKQSSNGIVIQAGQITFYNLLQLKGEQMGLLDNNYRLLPSPKRLTKGLESLAGAFTEVSGRQVVVTAEDDRWIWHTGDCLMCRSGRDNALICYFMVGLLQEYLAWASGDKHFPLLEAGCLPEADQACVIQFSRQPLD